MRQLRFASILLAGAALAGCVVDEDYEDYDEESDSQEVAALPDLYLGGLQDYGFFQRARGCNSGAMVQVNSNQFVYLKSKNLTTGQVASMIGWYGPFYWYANYCVQSAALVESVVSSSYPTTYDLTIDSTNVIPEANETNNVLRVGSDFIASFLMRDDQVYRFQYCNIGQLPIAPTSENVMKLKFTNKTLGVDWSAWAAIPSPQSCREATVPCGDIGDPTCQSAVTIKAKIDSTKAVIELVETNNKTVMKFAAGDRNGTPVPDDDPADL